MDYESDFGLGRFTLWLAERYGWMEKFASVFNRVDLLVAILLWLVAALMWWSEPLAPTYFAPTPRAPRNPY